MYKQICCVIRKKNIFPRLLKALKKDTAFLGISMRLTHTHEAVLLHPPGAPIRVVASGRRVLSVQFSC